MKHHNFNHFGHEHLLIPLVLDEGDELYCKACELVIIEPFHGCLSCNYFLHDACLNIPRSILHPSHPDHPLTLLPIPTYPTSVFTCNACGSNGNGFSYSCAHCEFDIHIRCASLPRKVKHLGKHHHELKLTFGDKNSIFECYECGNAVEVDHWRYYCAECDFGMHLGCCVEVDQEVGLSHCSSEANDSGFEGKSGTAQAVQPAKMMDHGQSSMEELRNEMMQQKLAVAMLQNQFNLSASVAQLVKNL